jgi:hypothetical protein
MKIKTSWSTPLVTTEILGHKPDTFTVKTVRNSTLTLTKETAGIGCCHQYGIPYSLFMAEVKLKLACFKT